MKKTLVFVLTLFICFTAFAACAPKLPQGMTQDGVSAAGESIISLLNAKDYEALGSKLDDTLAKALEQTPLSDIWEPFYSELGEYEKIEKTAITSQNGYAVYVAQVKYTNNTAVLTISFDKSYKLSGLYFK